MELLKAYKNLNDRIIGKESEPVRDVSAQAQEDKIFRPSATLIEWEAPERAFKKYTREFYRRMGVILIFFAFLLLIIQDYTVIAVLGVIFFVVYVFHSVPPRKVVHKITTNGVYYAMDYHYMWKELRSFHFEKKDNIRYLVMSTVDPLPGRIFLIIDKNITNETLLDILNKYISFDETPATNIYEDIMQAFRSKVKLKSFSQD